jgi:hypothetical protein
MAKAKSKVSAESNVYTGLLALAALALTATVAFMIYMCNSQYETIFKVVEATVR